METDLFALIRTIHSCTKAEAGPTQYPLAYFTHKMLMKILHLLNWMASFRLQGRQKKLT